MQATRRFWLVGLLGLVLLGGALVTASPVGLYGALGVGLYLLGTQLLFVAELRGVDDGLDVTRSVEPSRVRKRERVTIETRVQLADDTAATLLMANPVPAAMTVVDGQSEAIARSEETLTTAVRSPVTGQFELPPATVTVTGPFDLYSETIEAGAPLTLTVDPSEPGDVHVGQGGDRVAAAYGEHDAEHGTGGLTPGELRAYVTGDPLRRIDWKATARQNDLYVREFETQSDRRTMVVFDRRESMGDGPAGRQKVAYAREIALTYLQEAQRNNDPIGLLGVGTRGLTRSFDPGTTAAHYRRIDRALRMIQVQGTEDVQRYTLGPDVATRRMAALDDDTAFARRLRPFFAQQERYVEYLRAKPLFQAIAGRVGAGRDQTTFVVVTDDSHRTELREALELASARGNQVLVFLAPTAVFAAARTPTTENGRATYADFERFRREIARIPRVQAFEIGPDDASAASKRSAEPTPSEVRS